MTYLEVLKKEPKPINFEKLGLLEGLHGEVKEYVKQNYQIVTDYMMGDDYEQVTLVGSDTDITTLIIPIVRRVIGGTKDNAPNLMLIQNPKKLFKFIADTWKDAYPMFLEIEETRKQHRMTMDISAELARYVCDTIDYILKNN
jgi:hypothetical protein